jgi:hypothetical protein
MPPEWLVTAQANLRSRLRAFARMAVFEVSGQVAQLVEQRTENPCVGGSIPPLATNLPNQTKPSRFGLQKGLVGVILHVGQVV